MKCPKCGYLGFETVDRCRNCGYDFSLAPTPAQQPTELPLHDSRGAGAALADLDLAPTGVAPRSPADPPELDLDRLIGVEPDAPAPPDERRAVAHDRESRVPATRAAEPPLPDTPLSPAEPAAPAARADDDLPLPLFTPAPLGDEAPIDDPALLGPIVPPRPAGPPLAVRRASPEIPRGRPRNTRPVRRETPFAFEPAPDQAPARGATPSTGRAAPGAPAAFEAADRTQRVLAAALDVALLGAIDAIILYLTLKIAGLSASDIALIPPVPMASFLLLLDGGYLAAFTAAGGKTIGKMAMGIRVVGDDGRAVDASGAVLRAIGGILTALTLGLPYLPALLAADGRPLADRLAGTRVVRGD